MSDSYNRQEIERETIKAMQQENKAYCSTAQIEYTLEEAEKNHDKIAKEIIKKCGLKRTGKVLDIGCGFGDLTFALAKHSEKAYGIDLDKNFIEICKKKKRYYNRQNTEFATAKGEKLPFKDQTFDLVVSKTVLEHVNDVGKAIAEMARVTKKGGKIYIECPNYLWIKEDHYKVYMLPLMPKWLFKPYLRILGRNPNFIGHIKYVTPPRIEKELKANKIKFRNISEEMIKEILNNKPARISKTHPTIYKMIKASSKLRLNKLLSFGIMKTKIYPIIIYTGTK